MPILITHKTVASDPQEPLLGANEWNEEHDVSGIEIGDVDGLQTALDGKQPLSTVLTNTTASFTTADETKLDGIETGADVTDSVNVSAAGAVMESDYSPAHSVLVQQSGTGSPTALQIPNNTILGRLSGGGSNIDSLTATEVRALINVEEGAQINAVDSVNGQTGTVSLAKADIGLGNVDNTSDANKPISTATQTALDGKQPTGSYLTEAPLNTESYARRNGEWIEIPRFLTYLKTADTTRTESNAFVDDPDLVSEDLVANSFYRVELLLMTKADAATDLRFRVARTGLSDADLRLAGDLDNPVSGVFTWNTTQNMAGAGATALRMGNYIGYLRTGDNVGSVVIQWGQQVAGVGASTLALGSMLMLRRVS